MLFGELSIPISSPGDKVNSMTNKPDLKKVGLQLADVRQ